MSDRVARAALCRLTEPGDTRLTRLVAQLGAEQVVALLREQRDVAGVYSDVAVRMQGLDPDRELREAADRGIRFVCPGDDEWPAGLDDLADAEPVSDLGGTPLGLWVRGPLRLDEAVARSVAVVGSRSATTYGAEVAGGLGADLAAAGQTVVSGAAFGIDQAAHRGALAARGSTVAVLACGVDRAYPAAHKSLLDYVADTGLVVSELPPGCAPTRIRFLTRNRLIAALTQGTVVVEAAVRSGALNTATWAGRLSRVLMGVPGPVTSAPSEGVHELVRSGAAVLVTRGADVLELVTPAGDALAPVPRGPERPRDRLPPRDRQVLEAVPLASPAPARSIARTSGVALTDTEEALVRLRSRGFVVSGPAGWRLGPAAGADAGARLPGSVGAPP